MANRFSPNFRRGGATLAALGISLLANAALAAVTISTDTTQNMSCSGAVCAPTARDAVLNVTDLENYLAAGNIEVTTTGSGVQAKDIDVKAALTWSNASTLSLAANQAIKVDKPVSVTGVGGLSITNDGKNEDFSFGSSGNITFSSLSSSLTINGAAYTLVNSVKGLASAIASNPSGDFALASSYDAKGDGTYKQSPIGTEFSGVLDGLGNTISHIRITANGPAGLFSGLERSGVARNTGLSHVSVTAPKHGHDAGALAALTWGYISHCFSTGTVKAGAGGDVGGLVGLNAGTISDSYSTATVYAANGSYAGGLVGANQSNGGGLIEASFAMGAVSATDENGPRAIGGLVGGNTGAVENSYSIGAVTGGAYSDIGGFAGDTGPTISDSYSTGHVETGVNVGGFVGYDYSSGSLSDNYWDTSTSGISNPSQGAGYPSDDSGITGLTTTQLQSGLPAGFDPGVWAEDSKINNGLPYLVANPPQQ